MTDPLPSWNDGDPKTDINAFVRAVVGEDGVAGVPVADRVAVFDNNGTLWCEKPMPIQLDFILRRLVAMAEQEPGLRARQPWKAACERDYGWLSAVVVEHHAATTPTSASWPPGYSRRSKGSPWTTSRRARARSCVALTTPRWGGGTSRVRTRRWSNATGDIPILDYTQHPAHPCLRLLVRQDDPEGEFDYSAGAEQALSLAEAREWKVVSWKQVFRPGPSA